MNERSKLSPKFLAALKDFGVTDPPLSVCEEVDDIAAGCEAIALTWRCKDGVARCYECMIRFGMKHVPKDYKPGGSDPDGDFAAGHHAMHDDPPPGPPTINVRDFVIDRDYVVKPINPNNFSGPTDVTNL